MFGGQGCRIVVSSGTGGSFSVTVNGNSVGMKDLLGDYFVDYYSRATADCKPTSPKIHHHTGEGLWERDECHPGDQP